MPSTRNIGRYEILEQIGRGGMAVVYLARQIDLDRLVALKELSAFHASDAEWAQRFLRESRLAGSLTHPNIVTVYDYIEWDGTPFIAMEYVERGSLRPYVGTLTLAQIGGVLGDVLAGLAYAHRRNIVHRDLKPENLMVTSEGQVTITDFGIAKATSQLSSAAFQTSTGMTVGTPGYMAPEQAMASNLGPWTDLYSVGCMAYEFVVGQLPFADSIEPLPIILRHINEPIPPAKSVVPDIDPAISDWIDALLVKTPERRTQTAIDAWQDFEEILFELRGPRWRRESLLPEVAATTSRASTSKRARQTSILLSRDMLHAAGESASGAPGVLTPPPADAIAGPYTPPPTELDFTDPRDDGFVTFEAQPAQRPPDEPPESPPVPPKHSTPPAGAAAREPLDPTTGTSPRPDGAPRDADGPTHRSTSATDSLITAFHREPRRATAGVRRTVVAGVAVGVVLLVTLTVLLSGGGGENAAPTPTPTGAAVQAPPLSLTSGPMSVELPGTASRDAKGVSVAALESRDATSAETADGTRIMLGLTDAGDVTSTLLPNSIAPDAPGDEVSLGDVGAYRYDGLEAPDHDGVLTLFAIPTDAGVATLSCVTSQGVSTKICADVAQTLEIDDATVYELGPSAEYGRAIDAIVETLNDRVTRQVRRMNAAETAKGQATAAGGARKAFASATEAVRGTEVGPGDERAHTTLVAALRDAGTAYKQLAAAARRQSPQHFRKAGGRASAAERKVNGALATLADAGYDRLITARLSRHSIPSLNRPRPTPTAAPTADPSATAAPTAEPRPTVPPTSGPTPKPTPIPEGPSGGDG